MTGRWEVVCRMHTARSTWIVPISVGRRPHRTRLGAAVDAWRLNRRYRDWPAGRNGPRMTWEARRAS